MSARVWIPSTWPPATSCIQFENRNGQKPSLCMLGRGKGKGGVWACLHSPCGCKQCSGEPVFQAERTHLVLRPGVRFPCDAACQPLLTEKRGSLLSPFLPRPCEHTMHSWWPPTVRAPTSLVARMDRYPHPQHPPALPHRHWLPLYPRLPVPPPARPVTTPPSPPSAHVGRHLAEGPPARALGLAPLREWLTLGHTTCRGSWGPSSCVPEVLSLATDGSSGAASQWESPFTSHWQNETSEEHT